MLVVIWSAIEHTIPFDGPRSTLLGLSLKNSVFYLLSKDQGMEAEIVIKR